MKKVDLIVIGSGSCGSTVAEICAGAGWNVVVIDKQPFGGTCALRGCDPKKVLVHAAATLESARNLDSRGLDPHSLKINWRQLIAFKRTFTSPVPRSMLRSFKKAGITALKGLARFIDPTTIAVGNGKWKARHIVIATGSEPRPIEIPGTELLTTSDEFLELETLPKTIAFLGGGYISFEFAHVAARAGARVSILQHNNRVLDHFDPTLVKQLVGYTKHLGIELRLNTAVEALETKNGKLKIKTSKGTLSVDMIVHGAGRIADINDLDPDAGKVAAGEQGVLVNEFLQSISNPAVYAGGDAMCGSIQLSPVASFHGKVIANNLLFGNHERRRDSNEIPTVVFTTPPLAMVGFTEEKAAKQGYHFTIHANDTTAWYSSSHKAAPISGYKILVENRTNRILGAHLLGPNADEVINLFALAIRNNLTISDLSELLYAYPTNSADINYMID